MTFGLSAAAIGGIAAGVGAIGGAVISANGAESAANTQAQATQSQIAQQNYEFNTVQGLLNPYVTAGQGALTDYSGTLAQYNGALQQLKNLTGANGSSAQQTALTGLTSNPLYTTGMQLGQQSILQNASATGGLRGGNTIASLGYLPSQILSGVEQQQISGLGSALSGIQGLLSGQGALIQQGESAAAGTGTAALQTGNNITSLIGQQGAISAGASLAGTNSITSALNGFSSYMGTGGGSSALASLLSSAGGTAGGASTSALATSTPQDLIAGYTG
jgi:hypothetical protein